MCKITHITYEAQNEIPYYWKFKNIAEVDFVAQIGADIIPIEVKSERNDRAKSLAQYRKEYAPEHSVKTSMKLFSGDGTLRNIPLYLIGRLRELL